MFVLSIFIKFLDLPLDPCILFDFPGLKSLHIKKVPLSQFHVIERLVSDFKSRSIFITSRLEDVLTRFACI
jgi:hypothetical protein